MRSGELIVFDFCDTLVKGQTADPFLKALLQESRRGYWIRCAGIYDAIRRRSPFPLPGNGKKLLCAGLKGIPFERFKSVSKQYAKDTLIPNLKGLPVAHLQDAVKEGCHVVVISGGFTENIRDFLAILNLSKVEIIANEPRTDGQNLSGGLARPDCIGIEKIRRLRAHLAQRSFTPSHIIAYSDHESDMPLFAYADKKYIVSSDNNTELQSLFPWSIVR